MKTILLTVVLGIAVGAVAQNTSQPAQTQPATPATQGRHRLRDNDGGTGAGRSRSGSGPGD